MGNGGIRFSCSGSGGTRGYRGGGKVIKGRFMTPLPYPGDPGSMTRGQEENFNKKVNRVLEMAENLRSICPSPSFSLQDLRLNAENLIMKLFQPDRFLLLLLAQGEKVKPGLEEKVVKDEQVVKYMEFSNNVARLRRREVRIIERNMDVAISTKLEDPKFPNLNPLIEASLSEGRAIYVPDLHQNSAYVTGHVREKLYYLFSIHLASLGIDVAGFRDIPYGSAAVAPLITRVDEETEEYERLGAFAVMRERGKEMFPSAPGQGIGCYNLVPFGNYANQFAKAFNHFLRNK